MYLYHYIFIIDHNVYVNDMLRGRPVSAHV